ncbi:MAG TPA: WYL domain-containing protein [Anaeromyxobacteraceae bacterium]|nr:WYL domain-containing protein [Anaeromyxobacteraceae bacterium]
MSDNFVKRTRRLLLLIPAVWKATAAGRKGITVAQAVRVTGAKDEAMVRADVESLHGLSLAPSMPDDQLLLEIEGDVVRVDRTLSLSEPPRFSLREGAALLAALQPFEEDAGATVKGVVRKLRRAIPEYLRERAQQMARATDFQVAPQGEWASALEEAISRRLEVIVEYRASATADSSRKALEPRLLFPQDGHWYLAAWNVEKGEEHLYRLDRIVSVEIGARVYGAHKGPPVERYRSKQLYFAAGSEREVGVRFRDIAAKIALERWPRSASTEADGTVLVTARLTPGPYLYGWVLGFGGDAQIVSPPDVRDAFEAHVTMLREAYATRAAASAQG